MDHHGRSMARRPFLLALLLAVLLAGAGCGDGRSGGSDSAAGPTPGRMIRYMPLGDSITDGYDVEGGYRTLLWQLLVQEDGDKIDFVGSRASGPPELGDKDNEGHGGWCIDGPCGDPTGTHVVAPRIEEWVRASRPDIVSIHLGTNDIKKGADGAETARRLDALVGRIYAVDPDVHVILCQIVAARMDVPQHDAYAAAVPGIADRYRAQGRSVAVVDLSRLLTVPVHYVDGTHPTKVGYELMARALHPAVSQAYREVAAANPEAPGAG